MLKIAIPLLMSFLTGCGTVLTFSSPDTPQPPYEPRVFGGVRLDTLGVTKSAELESPLGALLTVVFALDLPLSAAADLVTLPLTLVLEAVRCSDPRSPDPGPRVENPPSHGRALLEKYRHASTPH
jgi:uncharacterized protein YceK